MHEPDNAPTLTSSSPVTPTVNNDLIHDYMKGSSFDNNDPWRGGAHISPTKIRKTATTLTTPQLHPLPSVMISEWSLIGKRSKVDNIMHGSYLKTVQNISEMNKKL